VVEVKHSSTAAIVPSGRDLLLPIPYEGRAPI